MDLSKKYLYAKYLKIPQETTTEIWTYAVRARNEINYAGWNLEKKTEYGKYEVYSMNMYSMKYNLFFEVSVYMSILTLCDKTAVTGVRNIIKITILQIRREHYSVNFMLHNVTTITILPPVAGEI